VPSCSGGGEKRSGKELYNEFGFGRDLTSADTPSLFASLK
jgi:hypothetical protein